MELLIKKEIENKKIENNFSESFLSNIKEPYKEHKIEKRTILQKFFMCDESILYNIQDFHYNKFYFSSSYSGKVLFIGISKNKIGVDIEKVKTRNDILLKNNEYELNKLGNISRENFYILWTAKESILKAENTNNIDKMDTIQLRKIEDHKKIINNIAFSLKLSFEYNGKTQTVYTGHENGYTYSICEK